MGRFSGTFGVCFGLVLGGVFVACFFLPVMLQNQFLTYEIHIRKRFMLLISYYVVYQVDKQKR